MRHDGGKIMRIAIAQKERHTARRQQSCNLMQHGLGQGQGALAYPDAQQQFRLGIDGGPDLMRRPRELLHRSGFTHVHRGPH